jgi:hypothetical protein
MQFTLWHSLYGMTSYQAVDETWPELISRFSTHVVLTEKDAAPGFGPYTLRLPAKACHTALVASEALSVHRCDACVDRLTMAVYDVDTGTADDVARCEELLKSANVTRLWYSTHSHTPHKPSYRLILPFATPVCPEAWPAIRLGILHRYAIPADPGKCSGRSHFYFMPSVRPGGEAWSYHADGDLLDPTSITFTQHAPRVEFATLAGFAWEPPPETGEPLNVTELRDELKRKAASLSRKGETVRAGWVRALLQGIPLAKKGERNSTTFKVAGMLAWALPGKPLSTYLFLMRPSVDAMVAEGSSITLEAVERMLLTAMRSKAEKDYLADESMKEIRRQLAQFRESVPYVEG